MHGHVYLTVLSLGRHGNVMDPYLNYVMACLILFITEMKHSFFQSMKHTHVHTNIYDPSREKGPYGICLKYRPGQPAQYAQSDHGRNFSLLAAFLCIKVPIAAR